MRRIFTFHTLESSTEQGKVMEAKHTINPREGGSGINFSLVGSSHWSQCETLRAYLYYWMRVTPVSAVLTSNLKVWESTENCFIAGTLLLTFPLPRIFIWIYWSLVFYSNQCFSLRILHILKLVKYVNVWNNFCLKRFEKFRATSQIFCPRSYQILQKSESDFCMIKCHS